MPDATAYAMFSMHHLTDIKDAAHPLALRPPPSQFYFAESIELLTENNTTSSYIHDTAKVSSQIPDKKSLSRTRASLNLLWIQVDPRIPGCNW